MPSVEMIGLNKARDLCGTSGQAGGELRDDGGGGLSLSRVHRNDGRTADIDSRPAEGRRPAPR